MASVWAPIVFWILLVPLLIVLLIVYLKGKKFSRLVYILSVFTYAMTIMYWIDVYSLSRNLIVGLLFASSILMMYIGKRQHTTKKKKTTTHKKLAIASLTVIAIIVGLSASPGIQVQTQQAQTIKQTDIFTILEEGQPYYRTGTALYTLTVTNNIIPRQYELPTAAACLYNSEKNAYQWANVQWDVGTQNTDFAPSITTLELGKETKTATLKITQEPRYKPMPIETKPISYEPEVYDTLYLFIGEENYVDCYNIPQEALTKAVKITIE